MALNKDHKTALKEAGHNVTVLHRDMTEKLYMRAVGCRTARWDGNL